MKIKMLIIILIALIMASSKSYAQDSLKLVATMTGEKPGDQFGIVSGVGDVNGDGFDDLLVGAPGGNYAKLYFGGAPFDTVADLKFAGVNIGRAGDVNGDGYNDILLLVAHKVYLYFGGSNMDTIPDFEFKGQYYAEIFGSTLTGVGDINADGFDDFIVSSSYNWYDGMGRTYLFYGGTTLISKPSIIFEGQYGGDNFGTAGIGIGDVNRDGFNDIMISAPAQGIPNDSGRVMIYFGGTEMDSVPDIIISGTNNDFGKTLANAGDLNGDGTTDFLISSNEYVYLYLGIDSLFVIPASNMGFGGYISIGAGGDINNDGYDDFIIGDTNYRNKYGVMVGGTRVYLGAAELDTLYDFSMEGEHKWDEFSKHMAIVGDLDGDSYDEVAIGAPYYPDYQNPKGKVYIYSYGLNDKIDDSKKISYPTIFRLNQNYPNPFNSSTKISYILKSASLIKLQILDCNGKLIKTVANGRKTAGEHSVVWEGRDNTGKYVPSGVYFCRISLQSSAKNINNYTKSIKIIFLK